MRRGISLLVFLSLWKHFWFSCWSNVGSSLYVEFTILISDVGNVSHTFTWVHLSQSVTMSAILFASISPDRAYILEDSCHYLRTLIVFMSMQVIFTTILIETIIVFFARWWVMVHCSQTVWILSFQLLLISLRRWHLLFPWNGNPEWRSCSQRCGMILFVLITI